MMMGIAFVGFATVATNLWFIYRKPSSPKARIKEHIKSLVGAGISSTPPSLRSAQFVYYQKSR